MFGTLRSLEGCFRSPDVLRLLMTLNPNAFNTVRMKRQRHGSYINYTRWLVGAAALVALVFLMVFFMSGNHHDTVASSAQHPVATHPANN